MGPKTLRPLHHSYGIRRDARLANAEDAGFGVLGIPKAQVYSCLSGFSTDSSCSVRQAFFFSARQTVRSDSQGSDWDKGSGVPETACHGLQKGATLQIGEMDVVHRRRLHDHDHYLRHRHVKILVLRMLRAKPWHGRVHYSTSC